MIVISAVVWVGSSMRVVNVCGSASSTSRTLRRRRGENLARAPPPRIRVPSIPVLPRALALLLTADPRAYDGPREAPAAEAPPSHPAPSVVRTPPVAPARKPPLDTPTPPQRTGRGLLIAGGIVAAGGLALAATGTALLFRPCPGCLDPRFGAMTTNVLARVVTIAALPLLGGGMQRRSARAARGLVAPRSHRRDRRRIATGAVMASVASVGMVASIPFDPFSIVALWAGPPIAIAGVLVAGAARGRRAGRLALAPIVAARMHGLAIAGTW
jgi:hypothetical protein